MIRETAEKLNFPPEAIEEFYNVYKGIVEKPEHCTRFNRAMDRFYTEAGNGFLEELTALAEESGFHPQQVDMTFLLAAAQPLKYFYHHNNIPEEIYWDSMEDLRYKLMENKKNYDRWGTFVTFWFQGFFWCERFKLGRLQYEKKLFKYPEYRGIKEGDRVFNCHIPSSGPLTPEAVMDSLKKAHAFYKDELKDGILPVVCNSWLLYTPFMGEVFPEGSNLWEFNKMFTHLREVDDPNCSNFWRIFDQEYDPATLKNAPADTGLRRRLKAFLEAGNPMGSAYCILLFDGEKII